MKKLLVFTMFLLIGNSMVYAEIQLKSKKLRVLTADHLDKYFEGRLETNHEVGYSKIYESDIEAKIVSSRKVEGKTISLMIKSKGVAMSYDYDFGDPVDEIPFTCYTTLDRSRGKWKALITACDY